MMVRRVALVGACSEIASRNCSDRLSRAPLPGAAQRGATSEWYGWAGGSGPLVVHGPVGRLLRDPGRQGVERPVGVDPGAQRGRHLGGIGPAPYRALPQPRDELGD